MQLACVDFFFLFLKNKLLSKENSGSTRPIFTKFLSYGRYLILDCRFDSLFSDGLRDVVMATNFIVNTGKIGLFAFILRHDISKRIAVSLF